MPSETTLQARWVLPIHGPPIENGCVVVAQGRVVACGKRQFEQRPVDLGDVALFPGWVNAHTHLEFSDLTWPVGEPGIELADWIGEVVRLRQRGEVSDAMSRGYRECVDCGTALIGEIATTPWTGGLDGLRASPNAPQVMAFAEVLGLSQERACERLLLAQRHLQTLGTAAGISPHAPYSTPPQLIDRCIDVAKQRGCVLAMHVAESPAERQLLQDGTGPFAENLARMGLDVAAHFPWVANEPILHLIDRLAEAPAAVLVHGNDLQPAEIQRLAQSSHVSVVYCPRTHAYFQHERHGVAELLNAGINVGLGTDSRASNPDLQLGREVQFLLNHRQDLPPEQVLRMATLGGAIALRRQSDFGSIRVGKLARFALIQTQARSLESLYADFAESDSMACSAETPSN